MGLPVTAIFDIGKTNKKFFLFDDKLNEVRHEYHQLPLIKDDDGFECDDIEALALWMKDTICEAMKDANFTLKRLNFSTYGATLVHIDAHGRPATPLYNYLKDFPGDLAAEFYRQYPEHENNLETASPSLGMLNSGLQLYWLKKKKPALFRTIRHTLHFPQFPSYLFTGRLVSEPTSIGCHTRLWNFVDNDYHAWVRNENLEHLFPPIVPATTTFEVPLNGQLVSVGVGIHDSSSALAAYRFRTSEPFALISTGTWSITLNPFTQEPLTDTELCRDCLNFLSIDGKPVKASRLFLGHELDHHLRRLNEAFHKEPRFYKTVTPDAALINAYISGTRQASFYPETIHNEALVRDVFPQRPQPGNRFASYEEGYHDLVWGLAQLQVASTRLALGRSSVKKIFIDGGFVDNSIFIEFLQRLLPAYNIEVSHLPLGSAHGAAMIMEI